MALAMPFESERREDQRSAVQCMYLYKSTRFHGPCPLRLSACLLVPTWTAGPGGALPSAHGLSCAKLVPGTGCGAWYLVPDCLLLLTWGVVTYQPSHFGPEPARTRHMTHDAWHMAHGKRQRARSIGATGGFRLCGAAAQRCACNFYLGGEGDCLLTD